MALELFFVSARTIKRHHHLDFTPLQVEAILLREIHEGMGTKGREIMDIFIDREGVPVITKDSGKVIKALPVDAPFNMKVKGLRYAMEIPAAIASPNAVTGAPSIRMLMASSMAGHEGCSRRGSQLRHGHGPD